MRRILAFLIFASAASADAAPPTAVGPSLQLAPLSEITIAGWASGSEAQARIDRILITQDAAFQPTEAPGGDNVPPGAATALVAAADDQQVSLSWTNPTDSGALRVVVRFSTGASAPLTPADGQPLIDRAATSGASDGVLHTGLTNGTTYRYSVFIIDASGNVSNPVSGSATPVPPVIPLGTVQNVRRTDRLP